MRAWKRIALSVTTSVFVVSSLAIKTLSQAARELQHCFRTVFGSSHQSAPDDDAIGKLADISRLLWRRDAESDANGKLRRRLEPIDGVRQRRLGFLLNASYSEPADKINESASVPRDFRHSLHWSR